MSGEWRALQPHARAEGTTARARRLRKGANIAEGRLWDELKGRQLGGFKFVRQLPIGPYFADFACRERRLVVEVDGSQHAGSEQDTKRDSYMVSTGWSVIRFWNVDVLGDLTSVCDTILAALEDCIPEDIEAADLRYRKALTRKQK